MSPTHCQHPFACSTATTSANTSSLEFPLSRYFKRSALGSRAEFLSLHAPHLVSHSLSLLLLIRSLLVIALVASKGFQRSKEDFLQNGLESSLRLAAGQHLLFQGGSGTYGTSLLFLPSPLSCTTLRLNSLVYSQSGKLFHHLGPCPASQRTSKLIQRIKGILQCMEWDPGLRMLQEVQETQSDRISRIRTMGGFGTSVLNLSIPFYSPGTLTNFLYGELGDPGIGPSNRRTIA